MEQADLTVCLDLLIHLGTGDTYRHMAGKIVEATAGVCIVAAYAEPPASAGIVFFHEPLAETLKSFGVTDLKIIGKYRDVIVYQFTTTRAPVPSDAVKSILPGMAGQRLLGPIQGGSALNDEGRRRCLFVLGMHRSGTSALTGLLQLLGVDLGSDLMAPQADNEKGFFENNKVVKLNERILAALGSDWDDLRPLPAGWWEREDIRAFQDEMAGVLTGEFGQAGLFAIKDPRLCRLMPIWTGVLDRLGLPFSSIIMMRNPAEINLSLEKRDGFSRLKSSLLWAQHVLSAERYSRDHPRVFIDFARIIRRSRPGRAADGRSAGLGLPHRIRCGKRGY